MIRLLCSGSLIADPVERATGKGDPFVTFTLACEVGKEGTKNVLVSCAAFTPDAVAEVLECRKGDDVCVAGRGELRHWTDTKTSEERTGLSCTVGRLLTVAKPPTHRAKKPEPEPKPASNEPAQPRAAEKARTGDGFKDLVDMEDDIPF
jgi:single-stranded DNA-binding protein